MKWEMIDQLGFEASGEMVGGRLDGADSGWLWI